MGSTLMYELLAEERYKQYRAEAEHDRRLAQFASRPRAKAEAVPAPHLKPVSATPARSRNGGVGRPAGTRRALVGAFLGLAAIGSLRRRKIVTR